MSSMPLIEPIDAERVFKIVSRTNPNSHETLLVQALTHSRFDVPQTHGLLSHKNRLLSISK
jgi:hypothetical protein